MSTKNHPTIRGAPLTYLEEGKSPPEPRRDCPNDGGHPQRDFARRVVCLVCGKPGGTLVKDGDPLELRGEKVATYHHEKCKEK